MAEEKQLRTISIPDPKKEWSALFKWLLDNASKDMTRFSMSCVKVFPGRIYYATNGYGLVRVEIYDDNLDFILPGLYMVLSCTSKFLHLLELEDFGFPDIEAFYSQFKADLSDIRLACYDPALLAQITKPFETVFMLATKSNAIELALKGGLLPWGKYTGILMGKSNNDGLKQFNDFFPAPEPAAVEPVSVPVQIPEVEA